jgi:hypothetical protein
MPTTPHIEQHFTATATVRDVVIGMSDGLTVPFALAAGLLGAAAATNIVVTAGLAEIAADSIAMGLGGYLAARTDAEHYAAQQVREQPETVNLPQVEEEEVAQVFREYGLSDEQIGPLVAAIRADRQRWVDFMMHFELGLEAPDPARARQSALTIALVVCGRRDDPAGALHLAAQSVHGPVGVGEDDAHRVVDLWLRQDPFYWPQPAARRRSDRAHRRAGCSDGLWHRPADRLVAR